MIKIDTRNAHRLAFVRARRNITGTADGLRLHPWANGVVRIGGVHLALPPLGHILAIYTARRAELRHDLKTLKYNRAADAETGSVPAYWNVQIERTAWAIARYSALIREWLSVPDLGTAKMEITPLFTSISAYPASPGSPESPVSPVSPASPR